MNTLGKSLGKVACLTIIFLLLPFIFCSAPLWAGSNPQDGPEVKAGETANAVEPLLLGKKIEKTISVGEIHSYDLKLRPGQTAEVLIEKQGVVLTATIFAPDGKRIGTFGSIATNMGNQPVNITAESAGQFRLAISALLKPTPPGRYLIRLNDVHDASDDELIKLALQRCQEKPWQDRDNNFKVNEALESISGCLGGVVFRLGKNYPKMSETADGAKADLDYLISRWHWGEFVSEAYRESVVGDFRMLTFAAGEPKAKMAVTIVNGVVEDLKIKADHCRKSNRGLGDDVDVNVRTIKENRKVDGLYVYYKLGIDAYKNESMPPTSFDRVSSPAHKKLPASWYLIWAGKPGEIEPPLKKMRRIEVDKEKARDGYDLLLP